MDIEYLLTATRSARKSLDLDAPVDIQDIGSACASVCRLPTARISRRGGGWWSPIRCCGARSPSCIGRPYLLRVGGQMLASVLPAGTPEGRLMSSTEWLVENMARVPLLVIPCYQRYLPRIDGDESFHQATLRVDLSGGVELSIGLAHPRLRDVRHDFASAPRRQGPAAARDSADLRPGLPAAGGPPECRAYVSSGPPPAGRRGGRTRPLGRPQPLEWICHRRMQRIYCGTSDSL
jgi:hypothetical protein